MYLSVVTCNVVGSRLLEYAHLYSSKAPVVAAEEETCLMYWDLLARYLF